VGGSNLSRHPWVKSSRRRHGPEGVDGESHGGIEGAAKRWSSKERSNVCDGDQLSLTPSILRKRW